MDIEVELHGSQYISLLLLFPPNISKCKKQKYKNKTLLAWKIYKERELSGQISPMGYRVQILGLAEELTFYEVFLGGLSSI